MNIPYKIFGLATLAMVTLFFGSPPVMQAADAVPGAKPSNYTLRDAVELSARGGLPNVFAKLRKGEPVKIAYFGGSITAQGGWRVKSRAWLQGQFPKSSITEVNAAIGGTGSDLGVFRVEADALASRPDLLFVEFAVNDAGAPADRVCKAMEGIVRKTWRMLPDTDICFVYTVTFRDTPSLAQTGKMKLSESVMEAVADHYRIPSIHFGIEVARLEKEGKLVMQSSEAPMTRVSGDSLDESAKLATDGQGKIIFSKDGVHPFPETGHVLYMQAFVRAFEQLRTAGAAGSHSLGGALRADNWEGARRVGLDEGAVLDGKVTKLDPQKDALTKPFANRMPSLWKLEPGATLKFRFKGTKASIYDLVGPDGAMLKITVDGGGWEAARFDKYCSYHRIGSLGIAENMADAVHDISITVLEKQPDKAAILGSRVDMDKSPEKYADTVWYPGMIFVVGEIVR